MSGRRGGRSRAAPDINNEISFPSLSGAPGPGETKSGRGSGGGRDDFEEVRSGGSGPQHSARASDGPRVTLDNKFAALRD